MSASTADKCVLQERDELFHSSDVRNTQALDADEITVLNEKITAFFPRAGNDPLDGWWLITCSFCFSGVVL